MTEQPQSDQAAGLQEAEAHAYAAVSAALADLERRGFDGGPLDVALAATDGRALAAALEELGERRRAGFGYHFRDLVAAARRVPAEVMAPADVGPLTDRERADELGEALDGIFAGGIMSYSDLADVTDAYVALRRLERDAPPPPQPADTDHDPIPPAARRLLVELEAVPGDYWTGDRFTGVRQAAEELNAELEVAGA